MSWYPGIDPVAARGSIYNDLPAVSFASGEVTSDGPDDAIADEAGAVLAGAATPSRDAFNLAPITLDRPFFYAVLRLDQLDTILKRLEILPQAEIGALVNLAVLAQAVVIAAAGAAGAAGRAAPAAPCRRSALLRPIVYFPALGLGFLFIEIYLIEKASLWLNDRTSGFALVLTGMLVFSGARQHGGRSSRRTPHDRHRAGVRSSSLVWCVAVLLALQPAILATLDLPWLGARRAGARGAGAGVAGARPAVPARPDADRVRRVAALGLGAERRVLCGRDATRQPDCARGRLQPGSAVRRDAVCDRAGDVSGNKEEQRVAASFRTITRRGVISAAGALALARAGACRGGLDARRL